MNKQSLEKSLQFLAPTLSGKKKTVSPVKVPDLDQEDDQEENFDINELLVEEPKSEEDEGESEEDEGESEEDEGESEEDEGESEEDEGESEEDEGESEEDEGESEEDEGESEEDEGESEEDEVEIRTTKANHLTPTRLKIKFPRSPRRSKTNKIEDLSTVLKNMRYSIIKLIMNQDESFISYAVCFDPNGEIVFVDLKNNNVKVFDEEKIIRVSYKDEKLDMSSSFIEGIRNKITFEIYGVVFYDGCDYSFIKRDEEGILGCDNFTTITSEKNKTDFLPFVYSIIDYNSLIKDPVTSIKRTKLTYQIIQEEQVESNKFTISSLMETSKELTNSLYSFDKTYKNITKDIVEDWKRLSGYSSEYYDKFNNDSLDEEEKANFDKVTVNMFARFQLFNEQVEKVDSLIKVIDKLKSSIFSINKTVEEIRSKSDNIKNKIIDIEDLELYI